MLPGFFLFYFLCNVAEFLFVVQLFVWGKSVLWVLSFDLVAGLGGGGGGGGEMNDIVNL